MQPVGRRPPEGRIVDVCVVVVEPGGTAPQALAQRREQGPVRAGVMVRPARRAERGQSTERDADRRGAVRRAQFGGDPAAELRAFGRGRTGHRDGRIVDVDAPVADLPGQALQRAELHHVQRPQAHHLRDSGPPGRAEPVRARGEDPPAQVVGELAEGEVEDTREDPLAGQGLQGAASGAADVEDQHLVAEFRQPLARRVHPGRGHARHARRDQGAAARAQPGRVALR